MRALIITSWHHLDSLEEEVEIHLRIDNGDTTLGEEFILTTTRDMLKEIRERTAG